MRWLRATNVARAERGRRTASVLAAMILATAIAACAREASRDAPAGSCSCEASGAQPVDTKLMAWLSKARTLHHMADLGEKEGAVDRAIAPLEQLVGGATPPGPSPEVDEVLADTYARLAELYARRGELDRAEADIAKGLERAPGKTYFRGHLLEVRGLIYEKLSASLAKAGKGAQAEEARQKAMRASVEAVRLQDEVIAGTLDQAGAPRSAASAHPAPTQNTRD